ncbi:hypothetical protein B0H19DRAFT_1275709 [Mycena capillaripes]|nr:hypothetical protein B0H19DRAFT_1275709 [Mycena capillaripes]
MSLPLPDLDTLTGCILVGTWVSSLLYMLEIVQSVYYFCHFQHDDWKFKTLVTVALVVDGLSFIGDCICVYEYTITHAGDLEYLATVHWPIPLYGFTTGVLGVLVQAFLVHRYWRLTQKTVIAMFLSFAIIISFGSVFTCSLMLTMHTSIEDRQKIKIPVGLWLVTEVAVDVGIASVLLWEFRKAKGILTEARSALDRLIALTIQSGAAAATLASGSLMAFYINPDSNFSMAILYPLGRVYVITLVRFLFSCPDRFGTLLSMSQLSNLNVRTSGKPVFKVGTYSGPGTSSGEQGPLTLTSWATDDPYGNRRRSILISGRTVNPMIFKAPRRSAFTDSWPEGIEMTTNYSSKKQSTLFAA